MNRDRGYHPLVLFAQFGARRVRYLRGLRETIEQLDRFPHRDHAAPSHLR